ncbi:MAG: cysteine synthase A [Candidatus Methanoplasma sp.]|jgi:cysteine synthase A|nr:cysteine synthase A [Candidatus Methanoplasma sp.]
MIYDNVTGLVGNTPLVRLRNLEKLKGIDAEIVGKLESRNPTGSVKDRIAFAMIEDAERRGAIREGTVLIEPTSGNTGIGLAGIAAAKGYRLILTMPETMSVERRNLLRVFGAELVLTPGAEGMKGAIRRADELARETPNSVILGQFVNPANPQFHERTTGPEIWRDADGRIDALVGGVGTGGTVTGAGRFLKSKDGRIRVVAVEPAGSPVLSGGSPGPHKIQGIGAGFKPAVYDSDVVDEVVAVSDESAFEYGRLLARAEGILAGISSGAALSAAAELAKRPEYRGGRIVVVLPDTGERYLSSAMFADMACDAIR